MIVLNFSHPLTPAQADTLGNPETRTVSVNIDLAAPLAPQIAAIVDNVGFSPDDWQSANVLVRLPGLADAAAVLLAELHGRMGYFPQIVQIVRFTDGQFVVAGSIALQGVRDAARTKRF